jgi:hypothetical protein
MVDHHGRLCSQSPWLRCPLQGQVQEAALARSATLYDDKLQSGRSRKDQERPLDRPDASGGRGDGWVRGAMSMAVGTILVMIVLVMTVPVRAEA